MTFSKAFIGLGSNLNSPKTQINSALTALDALEGVVVEKCSHFYASSPMGPKDQPEYINAVCQISTSLEPFALLAATQEIENQHGRVRKAEQWGPRTLDLDILMWDDLKLETERLTIPHYGMSTREFVLVPLFEIAPDTVMHDGRAIAQWVSECSLAGLYRLNENG